MENCIIYYIHTRKQYKRNAKYFVPRLQYNTRRCPGSLQPASMASAGMILTRHTHYTNYTPYYGSSQNCYSQMTQLLESMQQLCSNYVIIVGWMAVRRQPQLSDVNPINCVIWDAHLFNTTGICFLITFTLATVAQHPIDIQPTPLVSVRARPC